MKSIFNNLYNTLLTVTHRSMATSKPKPIQTFFLRVVLVFAFLAARTHQLCHATCATGSCSTDNSQYDCLSCNPAHFRTLYNNISPGQCVCQVSYVDAADLATTPTCVVGSCHYSCVGLCQGTSTLCKSCNSARHRVLSGTSCICDVGYYDDGSNQACLPCNSKCRTCSTSATTCSECKVEQYRVISGSACNCKSGYYEAGNDICSQCSHTCSTCSGASTTCTGTCPGGATRLTIPACACAAKYYDDGTSASCKSCHYSCATCSTGVTCDTCASAKFRQYSSATQLCACQPRYYDNNVQLCVACHATCLTCKAGALATQCVTCNVGSFRVFNPITLACDCDVGYYATSASVELCAACHATCMTCSSSTSTSCLTCNSAANRKLSTNTCVCIDGYYSNASNICAMCHSSCKTCTATGDGCATCPYTGQTVNAVTKICQCASTLVFDSATNTCTACSNKCTTCSITATNCTSCDSATKRRYISNNQCLCMTRYYDTGAANCAACLYRCLTCDSTGCLTCNATAKRVKVGTACACQLGYYDDLSNELCKACATTCESCTTASTTCATCDGSVKKRVLSGSTCKCINGYYDPGTGSPVCLACSNACATCTTNSTNCLTCASSTTRSSAPSCACISPSYDDKISAQCLACHYSCMTCLDGSSCLACDASKFRALSAATGLCICDVRYYDDGSNELCAACHATCYTCHAASASSCKSCNTSAMRVYNSVTSSCDCVQKYYQTAATTQLCSACHPTCLTCSGSSDTSCLSCSAGEQRTILATKCLCNPTFYLDSSSVCQSCHTSCATCTNSSKCATCPAATLSINPTTGVCECLATQAWDAGTSACIACHFSCETCSLLTTNCTTCDAATNHRIILPYSTPLLSSSTCPCMDGFYDNSVAVCAQCGYTCKTCDASGCLSCNSDNHRYLSGVTCPCADGYYDDGSNPSCLPCQYSCKACTAASACTACDALIHRVADTSYCKCEVKFYEDPTTLKCTACLYSCASCDVGSRCLTCQSATNHRALNASSTQCECMDTYYDDGANQLCQPCLYDCLTCSDFTKCTSCDLGTQFRTLNAANSRCVCTIRYYENVVPSPPVCASCHYSCLTCSNSQPTDCLTCNNSAYRIKNVVSGRCECAVGYYDDLSAELCLKCKYTCLTCTDGTTCTSCDDGTLRALATSQCPCPATNFYDDGSSKYCHSCQYSCHTCADTSTCLTCDAATFFREDDPAGSFCRCLDGYYDDLGSNELCLLCPYQCLTCTNSSVCLTCDTPAHFRQNPSRKCLCMDGYYDSGVAVCSLCQYTCKTCLVSDQCLTCNALMYRVYDPSTYYCACMDKYYDTGLSAMLCQPCHYSCKTCTSTATHCTSCLPTAHRTLDAGANSCPCDAYYYDDTIDQVCQPCHYSCLTCIDSASCTTCDALKHREYDANTDLCKCSDRYFDDGTSTQLCHPCQPSCLQCADLTACTDCDAASLRLLNSTANYLAVASPYCTCQYKYYAQPDQTLICLACHYTCAVCDGSSSTRCLHCTADAHRHYDSSTRTCPCNTGYFDNMTSVETCLSCHPWCLLCTNSTTTACTSCALPYYLKIDVTTCFDVCPDRSYPNSTTMTCQACQAHASTCLNATHSTSCDPGYPLYKNRCLAVCPVESTFLDAGNNVCVECPASCLSCNSLIECLTCKADYYYDGVLRLCLGCNKYCKGCTGPAQNQCKDCEYPLVFNGTDHQCYNKSCGYGQYVDSQLGCRSCGALFAHSLTCNASTPLTCSSTYKIKSNACEYCTNVSGYTLAYDSTTGANQCMEVCGDGVVLEYQCDDANNLDGDGCSYNCIVEEGWHCATDANGRSVCTLDGTVGMELTKVFKFGGENKVKLYLTLSMPIRLTKRYFALDLVGIADKSLFAWDFAQSQANLREIQFLIQYKTNIENQPIQLSYDTTRRRVLLQLLDSGLAPRLNEQTATMEDAYRAWNTYYQIPTQQQKTYSQGFSEYDLLQIEALSTAGSTQPATSPSSARRFLQSISLTFAKSLTLSTYPPAVYYSDTSVSELTSMKTSISIACIVLLSLCAISLLSIHKMYIHVFPAAILPAQVFILYGLALQPYTDWIKWSLTDPISKLAFVGGFKVTNDSIAATDFYAYSIQVTQNCGIVLCVMLALWILYMALAIAKMYLCAHDNRKYMDKMVMYSRYLILTLQYCLLPHLAYAGINALYNTSFTSQTSSINVCLGIAINVYLLGMVVAIVLMTRGLRADEVMLMIEDEYEERRYIDEREEANKEGGRNRDKQMEDNFKDEDVYKLKSKPRLNSNSKEELNETKKQLYLEYDSHHEHGEQERATDNDRSEVGSQQPNIRSNDSEVGINHHGRHTHNEQIQYNGIGYWYNHLEVYKKIEEQYLREWLVYDYAELYFTGGYAANYPCGDPAQAQQAERGGLEQNLYQSQQQNAGQKRAKTSTFKSAPAFRKYKYTKYYLPITLLKVYLTSLLASVLQSHPFILFLVLIATNAMYFSFVAVLRPFKFGYSNLRILFIEFCLALMNAIMAYYAYQATNTKYYNEFIEKSMIGIVATTLWVAVVLLGVEMVGAWRVQIWNRLQPCLVAMRLRGARKVMRYYRRQKPRHKTMQRMKEAKKQEEREEQLDAFFARMLKKQAIQKQYRRERLLKNPKPALS